jgi:hypothetical protein
LLGVPEKDVFTFNAGNAGNTEVIMLLLKPWKNGTIAERKIFPINIVSAAAPKQSAFVSESLMETPSQVATQFKPERYDLRQKQIII